MGSEKAFPASILKVWEPTTLTVGFLSWMSFWTVFTIRYVFSVRWAKLTGTLTVLSGLMATSWCLDNSMSGTFLHTSMQQGRERAEDISGGQWAEPRTLRSAGYGTIDFEGLSLATPFPDAESNADQTQNNKYKRDCYNHTPPLSVNTC